MARPVSIRMAGTGQALFGRSDGVGAVAVGRFGPLSVGLRGCGLPAVRPLGPLPLEMES